MAEAATSVPEPDRNTKASSGGTPAFLLALERLKEVQLDFFCDHLGQPCVRLPGSDRTWPIRSDRFQVWLAEWYWSDTGGTDGLARRDIDAMLTILEGRAWKSATQPTDEVKLWATIQGDPLAQAVLVFMAGKTMFAAPAAELLSELELTAHHHRIKKDPAAKWPKLAHMLSARLRELTDMLGAAGINIDRYRTNKGGFIRLRHVEPSFTSDAEVVQASLPASLTNSSVDQGLPGSGAGDAASYPANLLKQLRTIRSTRNDRRK